MTPTLTAPATDAPYAGLNRQRVRWSFGAQTLAAGGSFTITFQATVGASVPVRAQAYTNDAKVTYDNGPEVDSTTAVGTAGVIVNTAPSLTHVKTMQVFSDPFNGTSNPKAIPGAEILYTLQITNSGGGAADNNTIQVTDPIPTNTRFSSATSAAQARARWPSSTARRRAA